MGQTFQGNPFANLADGELTDNEGETLDDDLSSVTQGFSAMMTESREAFARMEARLSAMESGQQVFQPATPYQNPPPQYQAPPPTYQAPPPQPAYQGPPPAYHNPPAYPPAPHTAFNTQNTSGSGTVGGYGRGRGGGRGRGYGRGNSGRGRGPAQYPTAYQGNLNGYQANQHHQGQQGRGQYTQGYQAQQGRGQQQYGQQQQGRGGGRRQNAPYSNVNKNFDNDLFCWTCGYDISHDGHSCPRQRWSNHQPHATRYNLRQFMNCGAWCTKFRHKVMTPGGQRVTWDDVDPPNL